MNDKVRGVLENARKYGDRIRVFYGDPETGRDWCEEHGVMGYVARSVGPEKVYILLANSRAIGGLPILVDNVIKVTIDKRVVYQHPKYNLGEFEIRGRDVYRDGKLLARFESEDKARRYVEFLRGNRNRI